MSGADSVLRPVGRAADKARHLVRRFALSLSRRPPSAADVAWAGSLLTPAEFELWSSMERADRRHTLQVAHRFQERRPSADRDEMAAALLHDVGKLRCGLGTFGRVAATVVGPHTRRFRVYHDHEQIGVEMLAAIGASAETTALIDGTSTRADALAALRAADNI